MRVKISDVHKAFEIAANNVKETADADHQITDARMQGKLRTLGGVERDLTDSFVHLADHRDGALTVKDVDDTLKYAKEKLVNAYDLDNNGLTEDEIAKMPRVAQLAVELAKLLAAGKFRVGCGDGITDADREAMVELACSPTFGADEKLTRAVTLDVLPPAVRTEIEKGAAEFLARTVDGVLGYEARIEGVYQIYRSESDHRVVAYAVYGVGKGEPDYRDGMVYAFDPKGNCVYYADSNDRDELSASFNPDI
jgi:hypothetical protein